MGSSSTVFNMDNFTVTRTPVPNAGGDSSVPAINQGAGSGGRITGSNFLSAPNLQPGQDQVLVHSGDQSILLDQNRREWVNQSEYTTINQERHTTVNQDEEYNNKQKMTHNVTRDFIQNVWGPFHEEHFSTTIGVYHKAWDTTYWDTYKLHEDKPQMITKRTSEIIVQEGNSDTTQFGARTVRQWGVNMSGMAPLRVTGIGGLDLKGAATDLGLAGIKHSTSAMEGKISFVNFKTGFAKLDTNVATFDTRAMLIRPGIACVKAALVCVGNIRW
jgi:hypothetical protein